MSMGGAMGADARGELKHSLCGGGGVVVVVAAGRQGGQRARGVVKTNGCIRCAKNARKNDGCRDRCCTMDRTTAAGEGERERESERERGGGDDDGGGGGRRRE